MSDSEVRSNRLFRRTDVEPEGETEPRDVPQAAERFVITIDDLSRGDAEEINIILRDHGIRHDVSLKRNTDT